MINSGERLDDLCLDGLKLIQKIGGYGFTSDSVLLANFVKAKKNHTCVEIGTGSGIISVLVNYKEKPKQIFAFELLAGQADLAKRNASLNNMPQINVIEDAVQNYKKYINDGEVDVVFSNPPYFKFDPNVCGQQEEKIASRFDKYLRISEFFECASKMLKFGGSLFFVQDSARLAECFNEMKRVNLSPKRIYFVHPNGSKNSTVFLCEAKKGGKDGIVVMPPLFTNNLDGDYVETIQKLYKGKV